MWKWKSRCNITTVTPKTFLPSPTRSIRSMAARTFQGFRSALTRSINNFASSSGMLKEQKDEATITGDDVREGLVAVVSVKLPQPQFEGQTKGKLNSDIKGQVEQLVNEQPGRLFRQAHHRGPPHHREVHRRRARARSGPQGPRAHAPQIGHGFRRFARQTGRLPGARSRPLRILHRRGRIRRRLGQAGPRPPLSGHSAAQGQNPERRKGPLRQDAWSRGNPRHHHRARNRHRQRRFRRQPSCATTKSF